MSLEQAWHGMKSMHPYINCYDYYYIVTVIYDYEGALNEC